MNRYDKIPHTDPTGDAVTALGQQQNDALMDGLAGHFAERRKRNEGVAEARAERAETEKARLREQRKAGKLGWAAKLQMPPELRKLQKGWPDGQGSK